MYKVKTETNVRHSFDNYNVHSKIDKLDIVYSLEDRVVSLSDEGQMFTSIVNLDYEFQYAITKLPNGDRKCGVKASFHDIVKSTLQELSKFDFLNDLTNYRHFGREIVNKRLCDVFVKRSKNSNGNYIQVEIYMQKKGRSVFDSPYLPIMMRTLVENSAYVCFTNSILFFIFIFN